MPVFVILIEVIVIVIVLLLLVLLLGGQKDVPKVDQLLHLLIVQVDVLPQVIRVVVEHIEHVVFLSRLLLIV